jgi:thiamine biosynthesis lipoprotein
MGGHGTISLVGATGDLLDQAFALADRCEQLWSRFRPDSDISRLNWAEGQTLSVDPLTVRLLRAMQDGVELTAGDFDPTLLPALLASGYTASVVDPARITTLPDSARAPGNIRGIVVEESGDRITHQPGAQPGAQPGLVTVRLPLGTTLDSGGVAKGLTADLICEFALAAGAWGVMAEIGGDIVVAGNAPDGVAWRLGIEDPFDTSRHSAVVRLAKGAIVTSSQRKRRFPAVAGKSVGVGVGAGGNGEQTHHLIDPRSQGSARTEVQTVTVIASTGARAEVLTKPGFLRDTADYLEWLPSVGAAGLVLDANGLLSTSSNWSLYS